MFAQLGQSHRMVQKWTHMHTRIILILFGKFFSWIRTHMRDIRTLMPGLHIEVHIEILDESIEQSGLAWGAVSKKYLFGHCFQKYNINVFGTICKK